MTNKFWQFFAAPGDEEVALPIAPSPWHTGHCVCIPRGHWELIISYAKFLDLEFSDRLHSYSFASNNDDENNYVHYDWKELENIILFISDLQQSMNSSTPIRLEPSEELPDLYENSEYSNMLAAVSAVFQKALNCKQPFRAWVE